MQIKRLKMLGWAAAIIGGVMVFGAILKFRQYGDTYESALNDTSIIEVPAPNSQEAASKAFKISHEKQLSEFLLSMRGRVSLSYDESSGLVDPALHKTLRTLLKDQNWADNWRHIAKLLAFNDTTEDGFNSLRDYIVRWDDPEFASAISPSHFMYGKIETLAYIGVMPLHKVEPFLTTMLDDTSCHEILKDWPEDRIPDGFYKSKELLIQSFRGRAALGLMITNRPEAVQQVEELYFEITQQLLDSDIDLNEAPPEEAMNTEIAARLRFRDNLVDAMVAREVIRDYDKATYWRWRGAEVSEPKYRQYFQEYRNLQ